MDSEASFYEIVPLVCKAFYNHMDDIGKPAKFRVCNKENLHLERKIGEEKYRIKEKPRSPPPKNKSKDISRNRDRSK